MKAIFFFITGVALVLASQVSWAGWSCSAQCKGSQNSVLASLPSSASPGESSDFQASCTQILGGVIGTTSPSYCGAYYYCYKTEELSSTVSGSGDGLIAARQATRASCEGANFDEHTGDGCPYSYKSFQLDENSFKCAQD